jgi:hypothetical protein
MITFSQNMVYIPWIWLNSFQAHATYDQWHAKRLPAHSKSTGGHANSLTHMARDSQDTLRWSQDILKRGGPWWNGLTPTLMCYRANI